MAENENKIDIDSLETMVRGENAWNNAAGGIRGEVMSLDDVNREYERLNKEKKSSWIGRHAKWIIGLGAAAIAALVAGVIYFSTQEPEIVETIVEKEVPVEVVKEVEKTIKVKEEKEIPIVVVNKPEIDIESTPFNVVETYTGVKQDLRDFNSRDELDSMWAKLCYSWEDGEKIKCTIKKCRKYELKQKKVYDKEKGGTVLEIEKRCANEELIEILNINDFHLVDVKTEFDKNKVPRLVFKLIENDTTFSNQELTIDDDVRRLFEEIVLRLKSKKEMVMRGGILGSKLTYEGNTPSEQSDTFEHYLKYSLIHGLRDQFNLDFDGIECERFTEKAEIMFRYAVSVSPHKEGSVCPARLKRWGDKCDYENKELMSIEIHIKGFLPNEEKNSVIPSSSLTYDEGAGFFMKELAMRKMHELECEEVYSLPFSFLLEAIGSPPLYTCAKRVITLKTGTYEVIIPPTSSLTIEENNKLMRRVTDLLKSRIITINWATNYGCKVGDKEMHQNWILH